MAGGTSVQNNWWLYLIINKTQLQIEKKKGKYGIEYSLASASGGPCPGGWGSHAENGVFSPHIFHFKHCTMALFGYATDDHDDDHDHRLSVIETHTHSRLTALFPGLPGWAGTRKVKPIWILVKQETMSGNGISWAICKSAPRSRQTTMPAPHHSVFFTGQMPFLPPYQQCQSTEGTLSVIESQGHMS